MGKSYIKSWIILMLLTFFCISIIGCGETIGGAGKDIRRMGKGVKTIFVRDTAGE